MQGNLSKSDQLLVFGTRGRRQVQLRAGGRRLRLGRVGQHGQRGVGVPPAADHAPARPRPARRQDSTGALR